jgi:6-phosphofructokinase 1
MVTLVREAATTTDGYQCGFGVVPLAAIANRERRLPETFLDQGGLGVTSAFRAYALPLLGPAPEPFCELA